VPIAIIAKQELKDTATLTDLNVETTIVEILPQNDSYIVEGWIDLSQLQLNDVVVIRIYIAVDGVNYQSYLTLQLAGPLQDPVYRIHAMTLCSTMRYKVTITQTAGTPRSFPYGFVVEVMGSV